MRKLPSSGVPSARILKVRAPWLKGWTVDRAKLFSYRLQPGGRRYRVADDDRSQTTTDHQQSRAHDHRDAESSRKPTVESGRLTGQRASEWGTSGTRLVERGELLAALDRAVTRKVTMISAPAGSGKTSLLRAWADRLGETHQVAFV